MLNEKQIEALKKGAYGVNRQGQKVKVVGINRKYRRPILCIVDVGGYDEVQTLRSDLTLYEDEESGLDIVGLWEDKPEPFNLERALAGEPVKLVNGKKAYVLKQLTNTYGDWLLGYIDYDTYQVVCDWGVTGGVDLSTHEENFSIASMWKEPEPVKLSTDDLPKPIKDFDDLKEAWRLSFPTFLINTFQLNLVKLMKNGIKKII